MELFSQFIKELGPIRFGLSILGAIVFLLIFVFYMYSTTNKTMVTLFTNLELDDSNKIIKELETKNIPFEIADGGSRIKVPEDKVLRLRMDLAEAGMPSRGAIVGYELFDKGESLTTSNFLQNVNYIRAIEGEIARTISSFEKVDKARVHLVVPKRELFSKERLSPRASIQIKMRGNKVLNKTEIDAIAHLVVTAVPDLDIDQVTIVDTKGKSLKLGGKDTNTQDGLNSQEYKVSYENRLKAMVEDLLEQSVGLGKVKAYITLDMNFDRIVTNSEVFDPDGKVPRSVQTVEQKENNYTKDDVGDISSANNLPDSGASSLNTKSNSSTQRTDETTNFEISKTVKNHISETGTIKRLSIAVLVDGLYEYNKDLDKYEYKKRSDEELAKYANLVKSAVGFDEKRGDKIEVTNLQLIQDLDALKGESLIDWIKQETPNLVQTLAVAIVASMLFIMVIRPIALKVFDVDKEELLKDSAQEQLSILTQAQSDSEKSAVDSLKEAIEEVDKSEKSIKNASSIKKLNDLVGGNPQEAMILIRKWLQEDA
jgi:flagellar M-ring protein FliF